MSKVRDLVNKIKELQRENPKEYMKFQKDILSELFSDRDIKKLLTNELLNDNEFKDELFKEIIHRTNRRDILATGLGIGIATLGISSVLGSADARTVITDKNIYIDGINGLLPIPVSVFIYKKDNTIYGINYDGTNITKGKSDVHDNDVITSAIEYMKENGGGVIRFDNSTYNNVAINISEQLPIMIELGTATLKGNGKDAVIKINTKPSGDVFTSIRGGRIVGNGSNGIEVVDTYHTYIENVTIEKCKIGILLKDVNYWTESTFILNSLLHFNNVGLQFDTDRDESSSFDQTRIFGLDIDTGDGIGINILKHCSVVRSFINATIWTGGTGIFCDGNVNDTIFQLGLEVSDSGVGIELGENLSSNFEFFGVMFGAGEHIKNPYNKPYIWHKYKGIVITPSSAFVAVLQIMDENGNELFAINKNAANKVVLGTFGGIGFWDYSLGRNSDVKLGRLIMTKIYSADYGGSFANFTPPAPAKGMMFLAEDTNATAPGKRLYICVDGTTWNYVDLS